MENPSFIAQNLKHIKERIALAALHAGREPEQVTLVAVSKTVPVTAIEYAIHAGQRHFGENRPEEGERKIPLITQTLHDTSATFEKPIWHMIGHIQSRKAPQVLAHFEMVHSIDRVSIAIKLSTLAEQAKRTIPVLLECNVSGEVSKYGFNAAGWERDIAIRQNIFNEIAPVLHLPGLKIKGLMTMAPLSDNTEELRPVFVSLRALRDALEEKFPEMILPHLSMGMSNDFEVAVEEGATLVRIGRAIFGERPL